MIPGSKSQSIRALILATLAKGQSTLTNVLACEDTEDAIRVCSQLGVKIVGSADRLVVEGAGLPLSTTGTLIDTGNSGITNRFVMPLLGLRDAATPPITYTCSPQMRARPSRSLVEALQQLGMTIVDLDQGAPFPIRVSGSLHGGKTSVSGITSQFLSALLLSLPCVDDDSEIIVTDLHERPYVEMTLRWLQQQGIHYSHQQDGGTDTFRISGGQRYQPFNITIPGDFSSASYFIAAAVLAQGHLELTGLDLQDPQGDKRLITILQDMGADIEDRDNSLIIRGGRPLNGIRVDANDIPDMVPTLAVIGTQTQTPLEIHNVGQARLKETDRIQSMTEGLRRMGIHVDEHDDGMVVTPGVLTGTRVRGYRDHRTVMAFALAGLLAEGSTEVEDAEAIGKTFPNFVELMKSVGATMKVRDGF